MDVLKQTIMAVQEHLVAIKKCKFKGKFNYVLTYYNYVSRLFYVRAFRIVSS